jgi:hypothetical protein
MAARAQHPVLRTKGAKMAAHLELKYLEIVVGDLDHAVSAVFQRIVDCVADPLPWIQSVTS